MNIDTLKQKQVCLVFVTLEVNGKLSFNGSFDFRLAGNLCIAILANTIKVTFLRITRATQCQQRQK